MNIRYEYDMMNQTIYTHVIIIYETMQSIIILYIMFILYINIILYIHIDVTLPSFTHHQAISLYSICKPILIV